MDQPKQSQGNLICFATRYKQPTDKRPHFSGRICEPDTGREFRVALWASKDKHGKVMFSGRSSDIASNDTAIEQIATMAGVGADAAALEDGGLKLEPGQIMIFTNGYKDAENPNRPDFYGRWNAGSGEKLVAVSIWARKSKTNQALLTGQTQYPQPGKSAGMEEMPFDADLEQDVGSAERSFAR